MLNDRFERLTAPRNSQSAENNSVQASLCRTKMSRAAKTPSPVISSPFCDSSAITLVPTLAGFMLSASSQLPLVY